MPRNVKLCQKKRAELTQGKWAELGLAILITPNPKEGTQRHQFATVGVSLKLPSRKNSKILGRMFIPGSHEEGGGERENILHMVMCSF